MAVGLSGNGRERTAGPGALLLRRLLILQGLLSTSAQFSLDAARSTSGSACDSGGSCIDERGYPSGVVCTWRVNSNVRLSTRFFDLAPGDSLRVNFNTFSGSTGPSSLTVLGAGSTITFFTFSGSKAGFSGFQICGSSTFSTSSNSGATGSDDEDDSTATGGKMFAVILGTLIFGCCFAAAPFPLKDYIRLVPKLSPGVGEGVLLWIFAVAAMATTDTFIAESGGSTTEVGIFEMKRSGGSVEERKCEATTNCDTDCCTSLDDRCRALKTFIIFGFFATFAATGLEPARVLVPLDMVHRYIPIGFALGAAFCYWVVMLILISLDIGSATDEGHTCGFAGASADVRLGAGFALVILLFLFSIVQAGLYFVYDDDNDDAIDSIGGMLNGGGGGGGGGGSASSTRATIQQDDDRVRANTAGAQNINPLFSKGVPPQGSTEAESLEAVIEALPDNPPPPGFDGESQCAYISERGNGQCRMNAGPYAIYCSRHKCSTCPRPVGSKEKQCSDCKVADGC